MADALALDMSTRRAIAGEDAFLRSDREGSVLFGSINMGARFDLGRLYLSPYLRNDYIRVRLSEQAERRANPLAVSFGKVERSTNVIIAGGKVELDVAVNGGVLSPNIRFEYRNRTWSGYSQGLAYTDTPLDVFDLREASGTDRQLSASAGIRINLEDFVLEAEYGTSTNTLESFDGGQARVGVSFKF